MVADGRDGRMLAEQRADAPRAIASITKMMTAYLALRAGALDKTYAVPVAATPDRRVDRGPATPGAGSPGRDLLEGLLVPSANDAAETLAIGIDGSESAFVRPDEPHGAPARHARHRLQGAVRPRHAEGSTRRRPTS